LYECTFPPASKKETLVTFDKCVDLGNDRVDLGDGCVGVVRAGKRAFRRYIKADQLQKAHLIKKLWETRPSL
jgi:hypothetical protein